MYGFLLFLHLVGLSIWLGSIVTVSVLMLVLKRDLQSAPMTELARKTVKIYNRFTHPSSFIVLLSGVGMLMMIGMDKHNTLPFWILFMEQAGSIVILAFIITLSIMGRKLTRQLAGNDLPRAQQSINRFVGASLGFAAAVLVVVYVVSVKLI